MADLSRAIRESVAVIGADGKMGQALMRLLGTRAVPVTRGTGWDPLRSCAGVIDFSSGDALRGWTQHCASAGLTPLAVVGTTGLAAADIAVLERFAQKTAAVFAPNFSLGVLAFEQIVREATRVLQPLGYEISLRETHHTQKKDSPSGTALKLAGIVQESAGLPALPPIASLREGSVVGDHSIDFIGRNDRIELRHSAQSRDVFAQGAIQVLDILIQRRASKSEQKGMVDIRSLIAG